MFRQREKLNIQKKIGSISFNVENAVESNIETKVMTNVFLGDAITAWKSINQRSLQRRRDMNSNIENILVSN